MSLPEPSSQAALDAGFMQRALELAARGEGHVEPNPMVGCVVVRGDQILGHGWHREFGGPHAEIEALRNAGTAARGATVYVTLEPCCHHGKTAPCANALLAAGVRRVVIAQRDPYPAVDGQSIRQLEAGGVRVEVGLLEKEARQLNAPYRKLLSCGRPWVIAKWAMTLDGKLAARSGQSRWISNATSRQVGHRLRGRVDAVVVGRRTVEMDDPLLTARPPGPRTALRVVLDTRATLSAESQLARTAREFPLLVAVGDEAAAHDRKRLETMGAEVFTCTGPSHAERWVSLLAELGRRTMTNVLLEGGGRALGAARDAGELDEVHVFLAPRLVGGASAPTPCMGLGADRISGGIPVALLHTEALDGDVHLWGRVRTNEVSEDRRVEEG